MPPTPASPPRRAGAPAPRPGPRRGRLATARRAAVDLPATAGAAGVARPRTWGRSPARSCGRALHPDRRRRARARGRRRGAVPRLPARPADSPGPAAPAGRPPARLDRRRRRVLAQRPRRRADHGGRLAAARPGRPAPATSTPATAPVYLGQLHAAELARRDLARAAAGFCRAHDATYRPHPSERDRLSRLLHALLASPRHPRRRRAAPGELAAPVVSVFSTGVLEAAARGLPAWVDFPDPPPGCGSSGTVTTCAPTAATRRRLPPAPTRSPRSPSPGSWRRHDLDPVRHPRPRRLEGHPPQEPRRLRRQAADRLDDRAGPRRAGPRSWPSRPRTPRSPRSRRPRRRRHQRPAELAEDTTATEPVVEHAIAAGRRPASVPTG